MTDTAGENNNLIQPKAKQIALEALVKYQKSSASMKQILREMRTEAILDQYVSHETLALGVIRYLNTIDFLIARAIGSIHPRSLSSTNRNLLRLAVYTGRWLDSDNLSSFSEDFTPQLQEALKKTISMNLDTLVVRLPKVNQISLQYSHPTFMVETLLTHLGEQETFQLLSANNMSRVHYLRTNNFRGNPKETIHELQELGVTLERDSSRRNLFRIMKGVDMVISSNLFLKGDILIHDKASVLTAEALNASPGEIIWDACAAPGMKTQLISEMMKNTGRIVASDVYSNRVRAAMNRSDFLGVKNTCWVQADACRMKVNGAQKVLIDAPCTSTGMIQGYPSFKWRLNKSVLMSIMSIQHKILDGILNAYKDDPGTEIVYATCSVLPHEGESQIDSIMNAHDIELIDSKIQGSFGYDGFQCSKKVRRLFPHKHETNGFFIAKMRINS
jgi:16S rRNA (cytosine967-C5)-methyltransferase